MDDYPNPQELKLLQAVESLMKDRMKKYDPSHDAYHVQRVRKMAMHIARQTTTASCQIDFLVVEVAALLHDILDKKYVPAEEAGDPYKFFFPLFSSLADQVDLIEDGRAELISRIVNNVSWSTEKSLIAQGGWTGWHQTCLELHCVQDADRLDAIGGIGIMRCAAFGAICGRPLMTPKGDPSETESSIKHFDDKLLRICGSLKTEPGRRIGIKRHQVMEAFLDAISEERDL